MANRDEFWIELERPDGSTKRYGPTRIPFGGQTAMRNAAKRLHGDGEVGKVYLVGDKSKLRARSCWIVARDTTPLCRRRVDTGVGRCRIATSRRAE